MTAQINDTVFYRKIEFESFGGSQEFFDPASLPFVPDGQRSTGCYRGYVAGASIIENRLFLTSLEIYVPAEVASRSVNGYGPELFGVLPKAGERCETAYQGFLLPVDFQGGLVVADRFIRGTHQHNYTTPLWEYETVIELIFDRGRLVEDHDRSAVAADLREKIAARRLRPRHPELRHRGDFLLAAYAYLQRRFAEDYFVRRPPRRQRGSL